MKASRPARAAKALPWALAALSGALLWTAFPPRAESEVAWIAWVPLLLAARPAQPGKAFRLGLVAGTAFWFPTLAWLWRLIENGGPWALVVLGHAALSTYCALYTAAFTGALSWLWQRAEPAPPGSPTPAPPRREAWSDLALALAATALWVGLEWLRSTLLSGFPWNHLGVSQAPNRGLIQLAAWGGVYAVSAPVMLLNLVFASTARRIWTAVRSRSATGRHWDLLTALALLLAALFTGQAELRRWERRERTSSELIVASVQPNAPSIFDRDEDSALDVMNRLREHTLRVSAFRPDVVVWPETVLFGMVPRDHDSMAFAFDMARRAGAPLLAGAVEIAPRPSGRPLIANVSWLFQPDGTVSHRYRKEHLVPFGEFIPLDRFFPWLERLSPIGYSCTPGTERVLMPVPMRGGLAAASRSEAPPRDRPEAVLSPLICFEDTVAGLARRAVRKGATVLVNQTNDAWFAGSSQPRQHHAQALFRAVENRTPLVRCSNAGISTVVSVTGRDGESADYFVLPVATRHPDWPLTPYTRWGDWLFAIPCLAIGLLACHHARRRALVLDAD